MRRFSNDFTAGEAKRWPAAAILPPAGKTSLVRAMTDRFLNRDGSSTLEAA